MVSFGYQRSRTAFIGVRTHPWARALSHIGGKLLALFLAARDAEEWPQKSKKRHEKECLPLATYGTF
jgi:hypothetical protein